MWKPRLYPYAKVLLINPNMFERRIARECLRMMKINSIVDISDSKEIPEAFKSHNFHLVVFDCDLDANSPAEVNAILKAADELNAYLDRVMLCVPKANLRTLRMAQALNLNTMVLKPYSTYTFCTHADAILAKSVGALAQLSPAASIRAQMAEAEMEAEKSVVELNL